MINFYQSSLLICNKQIWNPMGNPRRSVASASPTTTLDPSFGVLQERTVGFIGGYYAKSGV